MRYDLNNINDIINLGKIIDEAPEDTDNLKEIITNFENEFDKRNREQLIEEIEVY